MPLILPSLSISDLLPSSIGPLSLFPFTITSMALQMSKLVLPTTNNIARELDEIYKDLHELDFIEMEGPKIMHKKESSMQKEKQISVDPISLRESSVGEISFSKMLPSPNPIPDHDSAVPFPPPLLPSKHKFLSCSLPNSATSSPRLGSILSRKNLMMRDESHASPRQVDKLVNSQSLLKRNNNNNNNNQFWRSKSCVEGRTCASADELDDYLWLQSSNASEYKNNNNNNKQQYHHGSNYPINASYDNRGKLSSKNMNSSSNCNEDDFKCGALCLFLPGFGKAKPVRSRKAEAMVMNQNNMNNIAISRTVSLEKFECGSWASSTIIPDHDEDAESAVSLYFDLPLELIKNLGNDAHLPVSAAFVFDNKDIKGVLKNGSTSTRTGTGTGGGGGGGRKSHESSRHVRFSTSSPTSYPASPASCITPRLRKARDDFNAFLEAQSA